MSDKERIRRALEAMFGGGDAYPCECGVTHFELPEKRKGRIMYCGNCGREFTVKQAFDA